MHPRLLPLVAFASLAALGLTTASTAFAVTPKPNHVTLKVKITTSGKSVVSIPLTIHQIGGSATEKPLDVVVHMRKRPHFALPDVQEADTVVRVTYTSFCDGTLVGKRVLDIYPTRPRGTLMASFIVKDDRVRTCDPQYTTQAKAGMSIKIFLRGKLYASGEASSNYEVHTMIGVAPTAGG
jgi:hypothetical protein